jgi:1-deoxy-D-xylulose-5-phosphate reductoisomerase
MKKKNIAILGSTGSIGQSTLEVIRQNPDKFKVVALAAGKNVKLLKKQVEEFKPAFVSTLTKDGASVIGKCSSLKISSGTEGALRVASYPSADMVVSAIVGAAGLLPTLKAIEAGKDLALANKESLVIAGTLVMQEVRKKKVKLLPIDSEHSAVFQSLRGQRKKDVKSIILTASGGPFLKAPLSRLRSVTPKQALNHPTWNMGQRITVDSATMMNKGFEVIEARYLFGVEAEKIKVVIHPESIVHSMVEYVDGSIISQMGPSDMKVPIAYALAYPERLGLTARDGFNLQGRSLNFKAVDDRRFPSLGLAYEALRIGGKRGSTMTAVLNAADEVAVDMFLKKRLSFTGIYEVVRDVMEAHSVSAIRSIDDVMCADTWARETTLQVIKKRRR